MTNQQMIQQQEGKMPSTQETRTTPLGKTPSASPYQLRIAWPNKIRISIGIILAIVTWKLCHPWKNTNDYALSLVVVAFFLVFSWWQGRHLSTLLWESVKQKSRNRALKNIVPNVSAYAWDYNGQDSIELQTDNLDTTSNYATLYREENDVYANTVIAVTRPVHNEGTPVDRDIPWDIIVSFVHRFGVVAHSIKVITHQHGHEWRKYIAVTLSLHDNYARINSDYSVTPVEERPKNDNSDDTSTLIDRYDPKKQIQKLAYLSECTGRRIQESLCEDGWNGHLVEAHAFTHYLGDSRLVQEHLSYVMSENGAFTFFALSPHAVGSAMKTLANSDYNDVWTIIDFRVPNKNSGVFSTPASLQDPMWKEQLQFSATTLIHSSQPMPRHNPHEGMLKLRGNQQEFLAIAALASAQVPPHKTALTTVNLHEIHW